MVEIVHLRIKKSYRYLWLKTVTGVDLTQHCAKCLVGEYYKDISPRQRLHKNLVLPPGQYYYLCGVRNYPENIHVALEYAPGVSFIENTPLYEIEVMNARRIGIYADSIDPDLPQAKIKAFSTCRNWQFANWLKKRL